ncbi:glycosyltransferase [Salinimonas sediminis]|uniref:Glycosyl transferase family 28 n=1 Tax=Salinimonas sediminis TaxID=2303538 RepID=A0A346NMV8_9ALTE|nr:glycosyltransferase [Salinimonas sediminis]AXR06865.1 glycosyl transferase family 28 [Salinimonas sediminis]
MLFLTIGTQLPFDRLVGMVDKVNSELQLEIEAQVGNSKISANNLKTVSLLPPDEMDNKLDSCEVIISHAGMGTIITAIKRSKPIIIVPRVAALGEHRNDHQKDTVDSFRGVSGVYVAESYEELKELIIKRRTLEKPKGLNSPSIQRLVDFIAI